MTIFHATDLHYLAPELTDHGALFERVIAKGDGKVMDYIDEIVDAFAATVLAKKPDAVILSGDLTFNGEKRSHEVLAEKLTALKEDGIPVFVIPGNHDLYYPLAASYQGEKHTLVESVTADEFASIYAGFGYLDALSRDAASLSYAAALSDDLRLLMLDTNTVDAPSSVKEETLVWVKEQLKDARSIGAKVLAVSHQTLLSHNSMFRNGFVIQNSDDLSSLYESYGVIANLCGHMHLQHYAFSSSSALPDIVTSALSVTPIRYGVLNITSSGTTYTTESVDVSAWAVKQQLTDENLLDFDHYARQFFYDLSYRKTVEQLQENEPDLSSSAIERLASFTAEVNTAYFSGDLTTITWDDAIVNEWKALGSGLMHAMYFQSIKPELHKSFTRLTF